MLAHAQPPSNDDFDNAVAVANLPFRTTLVTAEATAAADDPTSCTNNGSVWFSFTPASDMTINADTFGSNYDTVLSAYTGSRGALSQVPGACNDDTGGLQSHIVFPATAGTTYHFLIGRCCGTGGSGGGDLVFSITSVQGPTNDNFAAAVAVPGVPFTHTVDITAATTEAGEPASSCGRAGRSVWYSFTPAETGSVMAETVPLTSSTTPVLTVFTGTSLTSLTEVACRGFGGRTAFRAVAGETYHLQLGDLSGSGPSVVQLTLQAAPPVRAEFASSPSDPSIFDSVSFFDQSSDPAGSGIARHEWLFGDGTSGTGCCPTHRYAADGDYTVQLTVTTSDGRMASTTRTVVVRTHDVEINRFTVPRSAAAGQTRAVNAFIKGYRYNETVRVELFKSVPGGFVPVGSLTQLVVPHPTRTTEFPFNYTFTGDDAAIGKITFKVVATIVDTRDALPTDNEIIAPPTAVT